MKSVYKKMLEGMQAKDKTKTNRRRNRKEPWFLYILRCADGTLYTGIAKDVEKRFGSHSSGKGARYTRTRLPLELLYQERCKSRTAALIRECEIKSFPRQKKEKLVQGGKF